MTSEIVLCPTYRHAVIKWEDLIRQYPDMWTRATKYPDVTLTSVFGTRYIFRIESEEYKLRGWSGDFIPFDKIDDLIKEIKLSCNPIEEKKMSELNTPTDSVVSAIIDEVSKIAFIKRRHLSLYEMRPIMKKHINKMIETMNRDIEVVETDKETDKEEEQI